MIFGGKVSRKEKKRRTQHQAWNDYVRYDDLKLTPMYYENQIVICVFTYLEVNVQF